MDFAIIVAQIMGIMYLSAGIGILVSKTNFTKMVDELQGSVIGMIGGAMGIIMGMIIISQHNVWDEGWTVLVTLVGWLALIKGVAYIAFPKTINIFKPLLKYQTSIGYFVVIIGLVFSYFGFIA